MTWMPERRRLATGLAAACAAVAGTAAFTGLPAASAARSCGPASARTLAHDGVARIYTPDRGGLLAAVRVYGCTFASSRTVSLGGGNQQYVELPTLGGSFAGYSLRQMGVDTGFARVRVIDLRSGRVLDDVAAASPTNRPESFIGVTSLVLNAHGHVAWIGSKSAIGVRQTTFEVRKIDASRASLLDAGTQIGSTSLRRHGRQISWVRDGARRTATLN
jgi:hypothetical protein